MEIHFQSESSVNSFSCHSDGLLSELISLSSQERELWDLPAVRNEAEHSESPISHSYLSSSQPCFGDNRKKHLWLRVWTLLFWWTFSTYFIHSIVQEMTLASHIMQTLGIQDCAPYNMNQYLYNLSCTISHSHHSYQHTNTQTTSVHRQKYRYLCHTHFLKHCTKFSVNFC